MLRKRVYHTLVMLCPAAALFAGGWLVLVHPSGAVLTGASIAVALAALLYFARPGNLDDRIRHFDLALGRAPAGMMILDLDGQVLWLNQTLEEIFDVEPNSLLGSPFRDLLTGEAWATIQAQRRNLLNGEQLEIEGYLNLRRAARTDDQPDADDAADASGASSHTRAGHTRERRTWTRAYANLVRDDHNRPEFISVQVLDLTAARSAHTAISIAESRLQQTLELTTDLIVTLDTRGRMIRANARANEALSGGAGSLVGRSIVDFITTADRQLFVNAFTNSRETPGAIRQLDEIRVVPGGHGKPRGAQRLLQAKLMSLPGANPTTMLICHDITYQAESLDLLRSSEARFSRIFHSSPDAILIVRHHDSLIMDFNAGFTRLLGYTREDAIGQLEIDLQLFADPEERRKIVSLLQSAAECTDVETCLTTKAGSTVKVEISLRYVEIQGEMCTLCIGRDLTSRLEAERDRRESEEKFHQIFAESPDGIIILKLEDFTVYDVNDAFSHGSGYSREELIGEPILDFETVVDRQSFDLAAQQILTNRRFSNREMTFRTRSGALVPVLLSATIIDLHGVSCALCIAKDVGELRTAQEQLRKEERRFRGAFEHAPIGILLINTDGRVFEANRFAADLLAYDSAPLEGVHISRLIPADDRGEFKETLRRLVQSTGEATRSERRMLCKDGLQIWTNFHIGIQRNDDGSPEYCIVQIADITEMKNSQRRVERMAFYDTLTDLANRRLFYDRLGQSIEQARRTRSLSALLYLDLDQFKRVNDTLGHEVGDVLLQEVATRLSQCVRRGDTVGRPGGDEFTILLNDIKTPTDAGYVAEKILDTLRTPLNLSGHQLVITTSLGITIIPEDGTDPNELMKNADLAMYRAKDHGRNNYQFYSEEMNTDSVKRLRTEFELRRALEREEFELYYQPKIRLSDQLVTGVECLIRWRHPERGLLAPSEFIEVAEETGAIVDMGNWIIAQACISGHSFSAHTGREIEVAINISPRQFKDPNLVATIRKCLRESGMKPGKLEIEITETMLMGDIEAAKQTVQRLHDLGVKLAIDDFGTGYSSLSYLKKFPIDTVKVDRSFITDIPESEDDKAITSAVIAMAHRLNMQVVAEGVENRAQLDFLLENQCEYAQGYLFSKPLPLTNIRSVLAPNVHLLRGS